MQLVDVARCGAVCVAAAALAVCRPPPLADAGPSPDAGAEVDAGTDDDVDAGVDTPPPPQPCSRPSDFWYDALIAPGRVPEGESTTGFWAASECFQSCAFGDLVGDEYHGGLPVEGSVTLTPEALHTIYVFSCSDGSGALYLPLYIDSGWSPDVSLVAVPSTTAPGQPVELTWSARNEVGPCQLEREPGGTVFPAPEGLRVYPLEPTVYTVVCFGYDDSVGSASVFVDVDPPLPPPPDSCPPGTQLWLNRCRTPIPAVELAAGGHHTCARLADGCVKCWGDNQGGQLGLEDTEHRGVEIGQMGDNLPCVDLPAAPVELAVGQATTCARLDDGTARCWGWGEFGVHGVDDLDTVGDEPGEMGDALRPVNVGFSVIEKLAVGGVHACALGDGGVLRCWGNNTASQVSAADVEYYAGGFPLEPIDLGAGFDIVDIVAGDAHTCALSSTGAVKCWGRGLDGRLGSGDDVDVPPGPDLPAVDLGGHAAVAVAATVANTCFLLDDDTVRCVGLGTEGANGTGSGDNLGDSPDETGEALIAIPFQREASPTALALGGQFGCAIVGAELICWGNNDVGQLGVGSTEAWGNQSWHVSAPPAGADLGGRTLTAEPALGYFHGCAAFDDDRVRCWGAPWSGRLGRGQQAPYGDSPGELGPLWPAVPLHYEPLP